jgi:hypothetical protein
MDDEVFNVNLDRLTIADIEAIEELADERIDVLFGPTRKLGPGLRIVGCVLKRKTHPDFTLEEAGNLIVNLDDKPVPPQPASGS